MNLLTDLHFLRPLWPLAVLPVLALLAWSASRPKSGDGGWGGVIDEKLLQPLLVGRLAESRLLRRLLAALALVLAAVALAGPAWQQLPQPVMQNSRALVLVLDLSPSMRVTDVAPSRLETAKFKLRDVLAEFQERPTGLIAFAGSAHVVAPISNDGNTVDNLLRTLSPNLMPVPGSRMTPALLRADELLRDGGGLRGDVLLITDSEPRDSTLKAAEKLASNGHRLTVLGVGTTEGSPIPDGEGGFLRDRSQRIVVAKLPRASLKQLALAGGGVYSDTDDENGLALLRRQSGEWLNSGNEDTPLTSDGWQDEGAWLLLPVLLLVAVGARKGLIFSLLPAAALGIAALQSPPAIAQDEVAAEAEYNESLLSPLFTNAHQRGQKALKNNSPDQAADLFNDPAWRATALYRAGRYKEAATEFTSVPGAVGDYNEGNALAKSGNLAAAVEAYERALTEQPDYGDAEANLELVKKLLEQQQEQQEQDNEQSDGDEGEQREDNQQSESGEQQEKQQGGESSESQTGEQSQGQESNDEPSEQQSQQADSSDAQQQGDEPNDNKPGENKPGENKPSENETSEAEPTDGSEQQGEPEQTEAEKDAAEQLAAEKAQEQQQQPGDDKAQQLGEANQQPMDEQSQALQQWLNRIPDDPGGLLRRKFSLQQQRQQQMGQRVEADGEAGW